MISLENKSLYQTQAYINGNFSDSESGKTFKVTNPYNNDVIAEVADCNIRDLDYAIQSAASGFKVWSAYSAGKRAKILRKWYELMMEHQEDLGYLLTLEQGKPLSEAKGEIAYGASFVEWFSEEARRAYGDVIPGHQADKRITVIKQPVGVVAAISPWNFPNAMITRKVAPALAAGCSVIIKPSELTPLSALAIAYLATEAGIPPGVLNVITTTNASDIGKRICDSEVIKKISFTGSTSVGKILLKQTADTVKKVTLELGGNAPFIVFDDADIEKAVEGCIASKFRNAGQTCVCANRIFVQSGIYKQFEEQLTKAVQTLKVGNGINPGIDIGPLINEAAVEKIENLKEDVLNKGGNVALGGKRGEGLFYEPTIITNVSNHMDIFNTEIFGPVVSLIEFSEVDEVIKMANDTPFGLASYFYGKDYSLIWKVAEALDYGMVGINTGMISTAVAPFGGVKESGFGREGSKYGMEEYMNIKYMCWQV